MAASIVSLRAESSEGQVHVLREAAPWIAASPVWRTLDQASAWWSGRRQACLTTAPWGNSAPMLASPASTPQSFLAGP